MKQEITVYTKNHCPACRMTKKWLSSRDIQFKELNIDSEPELIAELKLYGFISLPVVAVGSLDNAWAGFMPDRLKELQR